MTSIEISNRGLWHIITGRSSLQDPDQIGEELKQKKDRLLQGTAYYKEPSPQSAEALRKSQNVKPKRKEFVLKLSKFLNLDEWRSLQLFGSYLENDFRGSKQLLLEMLKNEAQTEGLMLKIMEYYFEERLHILQCTKFLLSYWQDPRHPYREEFAECIEAMQENDVLIMKILEQYKTSCSTTVPLHATVGSSLHLKTKCQRWALQFLREQILLLEIMLLYYKEFVVPAKSLANLAKLFQSQSFGLKQINRQLFEGQAEALLPHISYLQVLVLIVSLDLESLRKLIQEDSCSQHHLLQEKDSLEELDRFFLSWGDQPHHGPVMLAWAVFRYVTMEATQEQFVRRIGSKALQCSVFKYILGMLRSEEFSRSNVVSNTCKSLIYGLMVIVLTLFDEDTLGKLQLLVSVLSQALAEKGLCVDFWDSDLNTGAGLLLNSARSWFPLQFCPFLQLLKSLAGDKDSAAKVYDYMDNVTSYTELLRENQLSDIDCSGVNKIWRIVHPRLLYQNLFSPDSKELVMPTGTLGKVAPVPEGPAIIQWSYRYSCWKLFALEIDSFLESVGSGAAVDCQNVICIVELVNEVLHNDWSKAVYLKPLTSRLYLIIQRCTPSPNPPQDLIATCLLCLATVALRDPEQVWHHLQQTGFLPHCTSVKMSELDKTKVEFLGTAPGNFGAILSTKERLIGYYPVTMSTLNLLLKLIHGMGIVEETGSQPISVLDLAACLVFIMREVFTEFYKWRFGSLRDREEIGKRCLQLFNVVLGLHFKQKMAEPASDAMEAEVTDLPRTPSVLQDTLVLGLLFSEAGQSLLNILGTGVDTVDKLVSVGSSTGGYALALVELIKLAFSVLNRLLARKGKDDNISPLEEALTTQVIHQLRDKGASYSTSWGNSQLVTVIASYIHHKLDSQLPTLATLLLKRICMVAPMSMHASFGAEAVSLRDAFVSRLRTLSEDIKLKAVILEFIATAVETQPGLIELFLDLTYKDNKEFVIGQNSCLHAVLDIIDPEKQSGHHIPPELVSAAFFLLYSLWHDRRDAALMAVRMSPKFWEKLTRPLITGIESDEDEDYRYYMEISCYAMQIIALEAYYVSRGQIDDSLKTSMKTFCSENRYQYWGQFLKSLEQFVEDDQHKKFEEEKLKMLKAWRTYLVVCSSFQTEIFGLNDTRRRRSILEDTLQALKSQVSRVVSVESINASVELTSLYLMLLKKWKSCLEELNTLFQCLVDIIDTAHKNDAQLFVHIRVAMFSSISVLLQHARTEHLSEKLQSSHALVLLPLACEPLEYLRGRFSSEQKQQDRVLELSVFIIDEILNILLANPGQWLPVLREHALFASLVQALDMCIKMHENVEFTEAILHLFLSLSRIPMSAEALAVNNISQPLCLGLASLTYSVETPQASQPKSGPQSHVSTHNSDKSSQRSWDKVWQLSLAVMASVLRTLRHGFLKEALDFAGVHRERLAEALDSVQRSQSSDNLTEAEEVTAFLLELAHFFHEWRFTLPDVLILLQGRIGVLCQSCIALLTHPRLLAHLLEVSKGSASSTASTPDVQLSLSQTFSREMLRTYSYADDDSFRNSPLVSQTQTQLLKVLCNSLAMLRQFTPDICGILIDQGMDLEEFPPLLSLGFSSPTVDTEEPLSFGTLLACLGMALSNLGPADLKSPVKSPVRTLSESLPRSLLMFTMENALIIALSQACRYLRDPGLDPRVKQFLKRELGSELGNFLGGLFRHFVRRGLPPSPAGTQTSPSSAARRTPTKALAFTEAPEQKFFKLADTFVKQVLK
ncbi:nucleoporin NUP188 homolog isoform X2 [Stylophora pistillata]|uniref:nucleoporin NUP188 homolog isoform X2 n=1 Tax=Stylophora pistillata TaxID=50429 RepID=UPI000C03F569|nr:nucleoporin NUP188 homolog isoform X2 [Stylophora pistillata]